MNIRGYRWGRSEGGYRSGGSEDTSRERSIASSKRTLEDTVGEGATVNPNTLLVTMFCLIMPAPVRLQPREIARLPLPVHWCIANTQSVTMYCLIVPSPKHKKHRVKNTLEATTPPHRGA